MFSHRFFLLGKNHLTQPVTACHQWRSCLWLIVMSVLSRANKCESAISKKCRVGWKGQLVNTDTAASVQPGCTESLRSTDRKDTV